MKKYFYLLLILPFIIFSCKTTDTVTPEEQAKIDKAIILKYIADNNLTADSTASGLYYIIADSGVGPKPVSTSRVKVYFKGYLTNGYIFDENEPGFPFETFLSGVIKGWTEGVQLIGKGGKIKLLLPSALAYGTQATAEFEANSVLIFDIELESFQ
jgi:FKBP-type peptidyl-prolyl cis-trans isomerase FkpA